MARCRYPGRSLFQRCSYPDSSPAMIFYRHFRFFSALLFSVLLHLVLLANPGKFSLSAATGPNDSLPLSALSARLVLPVQPEAPAAVREQKEVVVAKVPDKVLPVPPRKVKREKSAQETLPPHPAQEPLPTPQAAGPASPPVDAAAPENVEAPVAVPEEGRIKEATPGALLITRNGGEPFGLPTAAMTGQVARVVMRFALFSGEEERQAGDGQHEFFSGMPDHFGIRNQYMLKVRPTDPEDDSWQVSMHGRLGSSGLNPLGYFVKGQVPDALTTVVDKRVGNRGGRMPDGLLDRQSLLYQFSLNPPEFGGGKLWLSDGNRHQGFKYELGGTETVEVASMGSVRALVIVLSSEKGDETIKLWLLPDMLYLPVRVRFTDAQGEIREQRAVSLDFSLQ